MENAKYDFDRSFQINILRLYAQDPIVLSTRTDAIQPAYFTSTDLQIICRNMLKYYYEYGKAPTASELKATVIEFIDDRDKPLYINTIETIYDEEINCDIKFLTEATMRFGGTIALADACFDIFNMLKAGGELTKAREIIDEALQVGYIQDSSIDIHDNIQWNNFRNIMNSSSIRVNKIMTMLPTFNSFSGGGLGKEEVGLIIGKPKIGKTTILTNLGATAVISGEKVWHVSLESKVEDLICLYASRFTGLSPDEILSDEPTYTSVINHNSLAKNRLRLSYFNPGELDVNKMRVTLNHFRAAYNFKPDLIVLDYADRMSGEKEYEKLGDLYDQFSSLAHDFHTAFWTASQINRHGWRDETVDVGRVANSSLKIANADMIWTLNQMPQEKKDNIIRIFVAMSRRSRDNYVLRCNIDYEKCFVSELAHSYISGDKIKFEKEEDNYNKYNK